MNRRVWAYLNIAGRLAIKKKDRRNYFLAAIGIRNDGVMVSSANGTPSEEPKRECHAEYRLSKKLDVGSDVYVARVRKLDGSFGMARPCYNCQKALSSRGVKKVYYTISNTNFGTIDLT